jgi:hypothetical protein
MMEKIILGPEAANEISEVLVSVDTISRTVSDMSSHIAVILTGGINLKRKFSPHIDECTHISGKSNIFANIPYIDGDLIIRNIFSGSEHPEMRYFVLLTNILAKMDCNGRIVLASAQMGHQ